MTPARHATRHASPAERFTAQSVKTGRRRQTDFEHALLSHREHGARRSDLQKYICAEHAVSQPVSHQRVPLTDPHSSALKAGGSTLLGIQLAIKTQRPGHEARYTHARMHTRTNAHTQASTKCVFGIHTAIETQRTGHDSWYTHTHTFTPATQPTSTC